MKSTSCIKQRKQQDLLVKLCHHFELASAYVLIDTQADANAKSPDIGRPSELQGFAQHIGPRECNVEDWLYGDSPSPVVAIVVERDSSSEWEEEEPNSDD